MNPNILRRVKITDGFWKNYQSLVMDTVIPYQEKILNDEIPGVEKSHALANFRIAAGLEEGEFYGMVFQDSDVAKWLEGVAYALSVRPDPALEERADRVIQIIEKAQQEDGYLNTFFTIKEPEHRWQNLQECHELYCAGHMMEAAAAYYEVTGKDRLLRVMERMAEHIGKRFGTEEGKEPGIPGHQEIELGLLRLYEVTGKESYKALARYFIDQRGRDPRYFAKEKEKRGWVHFDMDVDNMEYCQAHETVYDQKEAVGHSVRAVYMYTAMAQLAALYQDERLFEACQTLWDNMTNRRMYITGGIGSTVDGEAFTIDYDLPNDTVYAETCASIGLVFFARKMLESRMDGQYADVMERALYNGVISGMQLDGKNFFYVNPLETEPGVSGKLYGHKHVLPVRPGWYTCACCPPNLVRLLMSLGKYFWSEREGDVYSHIFAGGEASFDTMDIQVSGEYPWEGRVTYQIRGKAKEVHTLGIHIPSWIPRNRLKVTLNGEELETDGLIKDGYLLLRRSWGEEEVRLTFPMEVRRVYASQRVREDAGCVSLMRGPFVYCFEGVDNEGLLQSYRIPSTLEAETAACDQGPLKGATLLRLKAYRLSDQEDCLYSELPPIKKEARLTAVPYYAWGNRGENQMRVWMPEEA
ncbi:MAG: glycoside hydrolase family 127 protein [Eubacteriales bacterium]|nr:glycoside hydrolase family 127 protein [Eubacteriales bacterium]